mgnify:CR=1 FL=1
MTKLRILIADDHALVRMGITALLSSQRDMAVVGQVANGEEAVREALRLRPDIVIMDLMMPKLSGAEATRIIHEELPDIKIIILTSYGTSAELSQAISYGVVGALLKDTATDDIIAAIRTVAAGKTVIPKALLRMVQEDVSTLKLTDHQLEILSSVVRGFTNADIARQFSISEITVKKALQTIFSKIGAANRAEAASIAIRKNLVKN